MIYYYRLTKYDPTFRDERGHYKNLNEWTGIDIVGKKINRKIFTLKDYLVVENDYLNVLKNNLIKNSVSRMSISEIEYYPKSNKKILGFSRHEIVNTELICDIARLVFRDEMWCKFSNGKIFIHFGDDFYVYFSSRHKIFDNNVGFKKFGRVYVEEFKSPYC